MSTGQTKTSSAGGVMRIGDRQIITDDVFRIIIDHFPDIVHSVDADGRIVFTNRKAEQLLGYTRGELIGMEVQNIYSDEIVAAMKKGFKSLQKTGEKTVESMLKDRYGNRIPVEIRSFAIYDNDGNFVRTFSILRDIRGIKELQDGLVHAERLAAIGELSTGIVHDINNPLTVIAGCASLLKEDLQTVREKGTGDWASIDGLLGDLEHATRSIQKLANHLREFSRRIKDEPRPLDLAACANEALFLLQSKLRKCGITVANEMQEGAHFAKGEGNHLEQVFANLISNACDAMEGREQRTLTLRMCDTQRDGDSFWQCDLADTGCGIPPDVVRDIFNPFFTTKPKGKGTGLGLSVSRAIILDHGGDLCVHSEPGLGTVFSIVLPKFHPEHDATPPSQP